MQNIVGEFIHSDDVTRRYRFRIGTTLASALAGFIAGALGTTFYFWYVFRAVLPAICR
jgi:hypothetical protein